MESFKALQRTSCIIQARAGPFVTYNKSPDHEALLGLQGMLSALVDDGTRIHMKNNAVVEFHHTP
jgi:hypothetical protein